MGPDRMGFRDRLLGGPRDPYPPPPPPFIRDRMLSGGDPFGSKSKVGTLKYLYFLIVVN